MLILLCAFLFFFQLATDLYSSHEARAAQNAQSILLNDDWLLPQLFDRQVELQKPPLYYWLVACFGWLNGGRVDAWAVRLPAASRVRRGACWSCLNFAGGAVGRWPACWPAAFWRRAFTSPGWHVLAASTCR